MSGEITVLGPIAPDGEETLVPANGGDWWMAWHPPAGEPPGQPLRREIAEEACATVTGARLLGFVRSRCTSGHEEGLVLVRSIWLAEVTLLPWQPAHEIPFRRTVARGPTPQNDDHRCRAGRRLVRHRPDLLGGYAVIMALAQVRLTLVCSRPSLTPADRLHLVDRRPHGAAGGPRPPFPAS